MLIPKRRCLNSSHKFVSKKKKSSEKYKPNNLAEYVTDSITFLSYFKHLWVKTGYMRSLGGNLHSAVHSVHIIYKSGIQSDRKILNSFPVY